MISIAVGRSQQCGKELDCVVFFFLRVREVHLLLVLNRYLEVTTRKMKNVVVRLR